MKLPIEFLLLLVRHGLSTAAGVQVADGIMEKDDGQKLVGAVLLAGSLLWSAYRKYARQKEANTDVPVRTLAVALGLGLLIGVQGCASYSHTSPTGERTSFTSCLMFGKASQVRSHTEHTNYLRTVNIGSVQGGTEAEKLAPLLEAFAKGAVQGAK